MINMHKTITMFHIGWVARYFLYRVVYFVGGGWDSYFGRPIYHNGLRRIKVLSGSLGVFPNWRMEFLGKGFFYIKGNVRIGHNFHAIVGSDISIEDGVVIGPDVYISTHETMLRANKTVVKNRPILEEPIYIKEGAFVGKGAMIFPGVTVGRFAVIGAYALVKKNVADGEVVATPVRNL